MVTESGVWDQRPVDGQWPRGAIHATADGKPCIDHGPGVINLPAGGGDGLLQQLFQMRLVLEPHARQRQLTEALRFVLRDTALGAQHQSRV